MKAVRIVLWAVLAIVVLVVALAAFLIATFDANRHKDTLVELVRERSGRELQIGDLGLSVFPRLALNAQDLKLSEQDGRTAFAAIEAANLAVDVMPLLRGELRVDRIRLVRPQLRYTRSATGASNVDDLFGAAGAAGSAEKDKPARPAPEAGREKVLDIDGVELVEARIAIDDRQAGLTGEVSGLTLTLGRLAAGVPTPLTLEAGFDFRQPELRGQLKLGGQLTVAVQQVSLAGLELALRLAPVAGGSLVLDAKGDVQHDLAASHSRIKLAGKLDDTRFDTSVDSRAGEPLKFDFKADRLDVDRYTAAGKAPAGAAAPARPQGSGSAAGQGDAQPVDLSFAAGLKLDGKLAVDEIRASGLTLTRFSTALRGDGRNLVVAPIAAQAYGGGLAGELRLDGVANRLRVKQTFKDIQIGPLLRDLAAKDVLEGRGNLQLDLDTRGRNVGELKRALGGSASVALRDGAVKGFNLGQILRDGQALLSGRRDEAHQFRRTEQTDFSALDASFRIADGVARNDDLTLASPLLRVAGAGNIDIGRNSLDYTLRTTLAATAEGQGGAGAEQLRGLTVPVRLTGPLESPSPRVLWSEVAGDAARRALNERLQRSLGGSEGGSAGETAPAKPEDALKEEVGRRLRGLLR